MIDHKDHFNFEASNIHMRYDSKITANRITVIAGDIHIEGEASFHVTGMMLCLTALSTRVPRTIYGKNRLDGSPKTHCRKHSWVTLVFLFVIRIAVNNYSFVVQVMWCRP